MNHTLEDTTTTKCWIYFFPINVIDIFTVFNFKHYFASKQKKAENTEFRIGCVFVFECVSYVQFMST